MYKNLRKPYMELCKALTIGLRTSIGHSRDMGTTDQRQTHRSDLGLLEMS